jgi:ABC-type spermidine/putrescine transport system permease subunit I
VRDWPFGSMLSLMLTACVLVIAGSAAFLARRGLARA